MTYGEVPIGTEVEVTYVGGDDTAPIYSVRIGSQIYCVKGDPFRPPILPGRWSPRDPNGRYMRRGIFRRIA